MAKSSVITVKLNTLVKGERQVSDLTMEYQELAKAAKIAQEAVKTIKMTEVLNACASLGIAMQGLVSSVDFAAQGFKDFESAMRAANTMAGKAPAEYQALKDQVTDLAKTIPIARDALANGLYQVISNGVPEDNWMSYLEASAKSAVGGIADVGEVVKVTATIIKNYGMTWDQAMSIQDKIQLTAKNGVTSFEQLAAALPSVTGQAAQLGVTLDEMLAVMSTLTGVTGNTSEVSTQLASVLTALTKESSKAQKMAGELGIAFNASSIQMAGGLQNFLVLLDEAITKYSAKTGMLKESVYSQLFGRAEALRLVNALTGQLGSKYVENIKEITDNSKGVIDSCLNEIAQTSESKALLTKNKWAEAFDMIGAAAISVQPYLNFTATLTTTISGITAVCAALKGLYTTAKGLSFVQLAMNGVSLSSKKMAASMQILQTSFKMTATAARICAIAIRTLMLATVVGAAIMGVVLLVDKLNGKMKQTIALTNQMAGVEEKLLSVEERRKKETEDMNNRAAQSCQGEMAALNRLYQIAADDKRSREERVRAIKEMKRQYPDYFSKINAEKSNIEQLTRAYRALRDDIIKVAQARAAFDKISENEGKILELNMQIKDQDKVVEEKTEAYRKARENKQKVVKEVEGKDWTETRDNDYSLLSAYVDEASALKDVSKAQNYRAHLLKQVQDLREENDFYKQFIENSPEINHVSPIGVDGSGPDSSSGNKKGGDKIYSVEEILGRQMNTLKDYKDAIKDLQNTQEVADKETAQRIESQIIPMLEAEKNEFLGIGDAVEKPKHTSLVGSLAGGKEQIDIVRKAYADAMLSNAAGLEQLGKAEEYWHEKKEKGDKEDIQLATVKLYQIEKQKEALTKGADSWAKAQQSIDDYTKELDDLSKLSGKTLQIELRNIGFDGFKQKIQDIEKMLQQLDLTSAQKDALEQLKKRYEEFGKKAIDLPSKMRTAWGGFKGIAGAVDSVKSAIEGHNDVLSKGIAIVDAMISVYDGVKSVIDFMNLLQTVTTLATGAKVADTAATVAQTSAATVQAASGAETVASDVAVVAANKAATASFIELAAASYFAAHAYIPFAGFAIASGFAASAALVTKSMGLMAFADGGIAYGPTLGLFGEYAGAASNPEVVAPLDKLRSLIEPSDGIGGEVEFKIKDDYLYGILKRKTNKLKRTLG